MKPVLNYKRVVHLQYTKNDIERSVCKYQRVAIKETNNKHIWNKLKKMKKRLKYVKKELNNR